MIDIVTKPRSVKVSTEPRLVARRLKEAFGPKDPLGRKKAIDTRERIHQDDVDVMDLTAEEYKKLCEEFPILTALISSLKPLKPPKTIRNNEPSRTLSLGQPTQNALASDRNPQHYSGMRRAEEINRVSTVSRARTTLEVTVVPQDNPLKRKYAKFITSASPQEPEFVPENLEDGEIPIGSYARDPDPKRTLTARLNEHGKIAYTVRNLTQKLNIMKPNGSYAAVQPSDVPFVLEPFEKLNGHVQWWESATQGRANHDQKSLFDYIIRESKDLKMTNPTPWKNADDWEANPDLHIIHQFCLKIADKNARKEFLQVQNTNSDLAFPQANSVLNAVKWCKARLRKQEKELEDLLKSGTERTELARTFSKISSETWGITAKMQQVLLEIRRDDHPTTALPLSPETARLLRYSQSNDGAREPSVGACSPKISELLSRDVYHAVEPSPSNFATEQESDAEEDSKNFLKKAKIRQPMKTSSHIANPDTGGYNNVGQYHDQGDFIDSDELRIVDQKSWERSVA